MEAVLAEQQRMAPSPVTEEAELVRRALVERGLETPLIPTGLSRDEKYLRIKQSFTDITRTLGLDLRDDSLCETPHRIAKMYVDEVFAGLDYSEFPKISVIENKMNVEEMVRIDDIELVVEEDFAVDLTDDVVLHQHETVDLDVNREAIRIEARANLLIYFNENVFSHLQNIKKLGI